MTATKCPRRLEGRVAGGNTGRPYPTVESADGNSSLEERGVAFAGEALEAERVFLTAAWLDPAEANDAAYLVGLRGEHFTASEHSFVFAYCCCCAECDRTPTVDEAARLAVQCPDVALDDGDLFDILIPPLSTIEAGRIGEYSATVLDFANRRGLSREYAKRSVELFVGDDYEVVVRARNRHALPMLHGRVVS